MLMPCRRRVGLSKCIDVSRFIRPKAHSQGSKRHDCESGVRLEPHYDGLALRFASPMVQWAPSKPMADVLLHLEQDRSAPSTSHDVPTAVLPAV